MDLEEEIPRVLESVNPLAPKAVAFFNFSTGRYDLAPTAPPSITLLHLESCAVPRTSAEALNDADNFASLDDPEITAPKPVETETELTESDDSSFKRDEDINESAEMVDEQIMDGHRINYLSAASRREKKTPNAFNFCETAAQTEIPTLQTSFCQTLPLERAEFNAVITPSNIYDAYAADFERMQIEKLAQVAEGQPAPKLDKDKAMLPDEIESGSILSPVDLAERVAVQNVYDEISFDFGYYEEPADEYRTTGNLLPLWRFYFHLAVNDMQWNPVYHDCIAVGYGSTDMTTWVEKGAIILHTLKNPNKPIFRRITKRGVLSLAFNPQVPYFIAVGQYDGSVNVHDTTSKSPNALFESDYTQSHVNAVSVVLWMNRDKKEQQCVLSASFDGYVKRWLLESSSLICTLIMTITLPLDLPGPEGVFISVLGYAASMSMDLINPHMYFIGTYEGMILKCNSQHKDSVVEFKAHELPVRRIAHNLYVPTIFLSCSEDWNVKLWEDMRTEPSMVFDMREPVIDVAWSPHTSTVFAVLTTDGCLHVFDLIVDRYRPLCTQGVVSINKGREPSRVVFNDKSPIVAVGDTMGTVTLFKLSPNLRTPAKQSKKEYVEPWELEVRKLKKVLSYMKPVETTIRCNVPIKQV